MSFRDNQLLLNSKSRVRAEEEQSRWEVLMNLGGLVEGHWILLAFPLLLFEVVVAVELPEVPSGIIILGADSLK